MNAEWTYENKRISKEVMAAIQQDFKKVLPYIEAEVRLDRVEFRELWTAFRGYNGGYYVRELFFGLFTHRGDMYINFLVKGSISTTLTFGDACVTFLAIAKKHLGHDIHVETSDSDAAWRKGISLCQCILGHEYDLMDITRNGKLRYKTWELEHHGK